MAAYRSKDHPVIKLIAWEPERPAEWVNGHIMMSRSTSHAYAVTSDDGDVIINAGANFQGARHRERFEDLLGRKLKVRAIIFTQSHPDHIGGWANFIDPGAETIVQREFPRIAAERKMLGSFFEPRNRRVLAAMLPPLTDANNIDWFAARDPENPILFADEYRASFGGRCYELYATPSGETVDSLVVWLPDQKTLFTGNLMGAIYGALPNFYTARGDRDRSVTRFIEDIGKVLELGPELLITGHGEPIVGATRIKADLEKLRDAARYIHDETIRGMNSQKALSNLMQEIQLPEHLVMAPGRGPVSWYVRTVWEEYAGWFRQESTTELYATPPRAIWPELAEMAGGADALTLRARHHLAVGEPVEALHFIEIAQAAAPGHRDSLKAEMAALEQLIERNGGQAFDELGWLEGRLNQVKADLG